MIRQPSRSFWWKKQWVYQPGARVGLSRPTVGNGRGVTTRATFKRHHLKVLACMILKLTVYVRTPSFIRQKPDEIPIFGTSQLASVWQNFQFCQLFGLCFTVNLLFWGLLRVYDVTVTTYVGCLYLLWYAWKEETSSYTMVQL